MEMWQFWVIAAGIFFIMEILTYGFLLFWIGVGAILTMIASLFIDNVVIQTALFVISSSLLIFFTRSFAQKLLSRTKDVPTNVSALIGKRAIVTVPIDTTLGSGQVVVSRRTLVCKSR